ncbi:hypothetical protein F0P96_10570 [Hymenobacter busanensis]|uniref:Uncharacterized protein n=1 Tax=Hymenobacter busanensis TaxID=2607656 RepID=A0A7L4ZYJ8_9BACT|nr:hypothetical protein [Hymenobacter busanensis]KAA9333404.1 hypothetical protein F0P96_10570 [Hymenobacter busanensis]QHJ07916.1 hypothetical protein GUY19_11735 [Hymenobacter busanensis]
MYFGHLYVLIGHDLSATYAAAGFTDSATPAGDNPEDFEAIVWHASTGNKEGFFAILRPTATPETVAHEALHLSHYIMRSRGIKPDLNNDEPHAYLLGWLVRQMHYALTSKELVPAATISLP